MAAGSSLVSVASLRFKHPNERARNVTPNLKLQIQRRTEIGLEQIDPRADDSARRSEHATGRGATSGDQSEPESILEK